MYVAGDKSSTIITIEICKGRVILPIALVLYDECLWEELLEEVILHITPLCFIGYTFKGQVHVFTGRVKIVSHSSCSTSAILKYFCPLCSFMEVSQFFFFQIT